MSDETKLPDNVIDLFKKHLRNASCSDAQVAVCIADFVVERIFKDAAVEGVVPITVPMKQEWLARLLAGMFKQGLDEGRRRERDGQEE